MKKHGTSSGHSEEEINYSASALTRKRFLLIIGKNVLIVVLLALLFYDSLIAVLPLAPVCIVLTLKDRRRALEARTAELKKQFRECLLSVSSGLSAGYSPENAFRRSAQELCVLYDEDTDMVRELKSFGRRMDMNENLETILLDFAKRSNMEEAKSFSEVFVFARRSGGNLNRILSSTAQQITDRIDVEREIRTVTAAGRMEQQILNVIPAGICAYLKIASPGYLDVLYRNPAGIAIMTVCLGIYIAAYLISERMVAIEV